MKLEVSSPRRDRHVFPSQQFEFFLGKITVLRVGLWIGVEIVIENLCKFKAIWKTKTNSVFFMILIEKL